MEAGIGIEPIFTDLQSRFYCQNIKDLDGEKYQDKPGTPGEHDTDRFDASTPANETPAARASATGAKSNEQAFKSKHYLKRAEAATALCLAIADCDPSDACEIMVAALADLSAGWPIPPLFNFMDEAAFWADLAPMPELKAYALACYNRLPLTDQAAFLAYVGRAA